MTIEFAKLVNRLNTWSSSYNCEKIVSEVEALKQGERKIHQTKRGYTFCEKYTHEISCASDQQRGYDIWMTNKLMNSSHVYLEDIILNLYLAGFNQDNIVERLYAFVDAYKLWSVENK